MGSSPRGALALMLTGRAYAVVQGRDYVVPEDVKAVASAVLAHRITVRPESAPPRERMTFLFSDTNDEGTRLDLEWAGLRISVPVKVDTRTQVGAAIDKAVGDAWRPHYTAGRYLMESGGDLDTAIRYLDASISIKPTWWNHWFRAQALGKKGRSADAIASAEKAQELIDEGLDEDEAIELADEL